MRKDAASGPWRRLTTRERIAVGATALILLLATLPHLPPGVCFNDGGDLQLAAATLGVMHPPGYPGFVTVGYILTLVPGVEPAYMVSLGCLLSGVIALLLAMMLQIRLGVSAWLAGATVLMLSWHKRVWENLVSPEVYAPALAVVLGTAYLLVKYVHLGRRRDLFLAAFLFGFGVVNRPPTVYTLPLFAVAWLIGRQRWDPSWKRSAVNVGWCAMFAILPLAQGVGYLWLRDTPETSYNYINRYNEEFHELPEPEDGWEAKVQRVTWQITAKQFMQYMGNTWRGAWLRVVWVHKQFFLYRFVEFAGVPLTLGGHVFLLMLPVWLTGLFLAFQRSRAAFCVLVGIVIANFVFLATYRIYGQAGDLTPLMSVSMILVGLAFSAVFPRGGRSWRFGGAVAVFAAVAVFTAGYNLARGGRLSEDASGYLRDVDLATMPADSVICSTWQQSPALWYEKYVTTGRLDIEIINTTTYQWRGRIRDKQHRPLFSVTRAYSLTPEYELVPYRNLWRLIPRKEIASGPK